LASLYPTMSEAVATNRKARHEYEILDTFEAGLVLTGAEVKSLRAGRCSLQDGYVTVRRGEATLKGVHIAPYEHATRQGVDPLRDRRLLLHGRELLRLTKQLEERGLTLVPLRVYFKRGYAKVELGLAKGRHTYDKRHKLRDEDEKRRTEEALKRFSRGQNV
jgi:SsrA-binding protein